MPATLQSGCKYKNRTRQNKQKTTKYQGLWSGLSPPGRSGCLSPEPRLPNITPSKQNKIPKTISTPSHQRGQVFYRVASLAFFALDSKSWNHWRPRRPSFAQQGSHISIYSSAPHTEHSPHGAAWLHPRKVLVTFTRQESRP